MKNYFKRLFAGDKKKKFVFTSRNLARPTSNGERIADTNNPPGMILIDDYVNQSVSGLTYSNGAIAGITSSYSKSSDKVDERKEVKPIEVFKEIEKEGLEPDFNDIDRKIEAVEGRINILKEHLSNEHLYDEHKTLFYLRNRKKYLTTRKKYPFNWAMTNRDAIDDLCKRYKLQTVPLKQYYTLVPNEGIKEVSRFTKAYEAITKDKPIFELIIKQAESKTEEQKQRTRKDRDPILIANSPLGNFMFVLGAWDDEVEFVDEIIYNGK